MNKPNTMESVEPHSGSYSWKQDLRLNAWLAVAAVVYMVGLFLLKHNPAWSPLTRGLVTLTPLLPALLYVRSWMRFVGGLDELQRRIQTEAFLFAALGTVVVGVMVNALNASGVTVIDLTHGLDLGGVFFSMFTLWLVGTGLANARYK